MSEQVTQDSNVLYSHEAQERYKVFIKRQNKWIWLTSSNSRTEAIRDCDDVVYDEAVLIDFKTQMISFMVPSRIKIDAVKPGLRIVLREAKVDNGRRKYQDD